MAKRTFALVLLAALAAAVLPGNEAAARPLGWHYGGGQFPGAMRYVGPHGGWQRQRFGYGISASAVGFSIASGALYGNYVYPVAGGYYDPNYYAPEVYVTDDYYDRYYDTDLYVPSCYRRQTITTWDGVASAVVNTCF